MPPKPPEIPDPGPSELPKWVDTSAARKEEKQWLNLEFARQRNDGWWLFCYGVIVVMLTVVFSLLFVSTLIIWSIHYLAPQSWCWLTDTQLSKVQSILFSGGMGAIITSIIQKQLAKNDGQK